MRRRIVIAVAVVAAVLVVAAVIFAVIQANAAPTTLTSRSWTLTRLIVDGQEQPLSPSHPATLTFHTQDHNASGSGGCNSYGGSYVIFGSSLRFDNMRSTAMACMDKNVMDQEGAYLQALARVGSYHLDGDTLTLDGDSGRVTMTFQPGGQG